MSAKPYTEAEIAERRADPLMVISRGVPTILEPSEQRWLATVDALQARLAAAERERAKAVGLLLCYRILDNHGLDADKCGGLPDLPFDAMRAAGLPRAGHLGDCYDIVRRAVDDFRVRIASRPEGEVA